MYKFFFFVSLGAFFRLFVLPVWEWSLLLHRAFELTSPDAWQNRLVCPTRRRLLTHRVFSRRNPTWHFFSLIAKGILCLSQFDLWNCPPWREPQGCQTLRGPSGTSTPWCSAARWQGWQPSAIHESVLWAAHWECAPPPSSSYTSLPTYITLFLPFLSSMPLCPPPAANPSTHLIPFLPSPAFLSPDRPPCLGS